MRWVPGRSRWKLAVVAMVALAALGGIAFGLYTALNEEEAEAEAARLRWVNVSIELPPVEVGGIDVIRHEGLPDILLPSPGTRVPAIEVFRKKPLSTQTSIVFMDATTGEVVFEDVRPEDRQAFDAVLATLRFEGSDPPDVWPYSAGVPEERRQRASNITFVEPDPASGIKVTGGISDGPQGGMTFLTISNGRSRININADTGEILPELSPLFADPVGPDRVAFDRLASSIELSPR